MAANERPNDAQKLAAAREAVKLITPGMRLAWVAAAAPERRLEPG